jgi:hypothetical protein
MYDVLNKHYCKPFLSIQSHEATAWSNIVTKQSVVAVEGDFALFLCRRVVVVGALDRRLCFIE